MFASQEEAVAAAEDVYGRYVKIADQIFVDGGEHPERLEAVATGGYLRALLHGFARVRAEGQHSTGGTRFRDFSLQSYRPNGTTGILTAYVCEDISKVDVFDDQGDSVVSPTRPDTTIFQVAFDLGTDGNLRLSSREVWSNTKC
ncbi:MAG: hypothetical protein EPN91_09425 [Salinibacterium sp.]|nr:MAG: hypothetical protein EPN91_09425 [Salinibacterium sp.]